MMFEKVIEPIYILFQLKLIHDLGIGPIGTQHSHETP